MESETCDCVRGLGVLNEWEDGGMGGLVVVGRRFFRSVLLHETKVLDLGSE